MPASLWKEDFGSNQRTYVQLAGVNWSTARFIFPVVVWISLNRICALLRMLRYIQTCKMIPKLKYNFYFLLIHTNNQLRDSCETLLVQLVFIDISKQRKLVPLDCLDILGFLRTCGFHKYTKPEKNRKKASLTWCLPSGRFSSPKTGRPSCPARCPLHYTTVCPVLPDPTSILQSLAAGAWRTAVKKKCIYLLKDVRVFFNQGATFLSLVFERFCDAVGTVASKYVIRLSPEM